MFVFHTRSCNWKTVLGTHMVLLEKKVLFTIVASGGRVEIKFPPEG